MDRKILGRRTAVFKQKKKKKEKKKRERKKKKKWPAYITDDWGWNRAGCAYTSYRRLMFDTHRALSVVDPLLLPAEDFADTAVTDP